MRTKVYRVYDVCSEVYGNPMYFPTHASALRAFAAACNDQQTALGQHPRDYTLFHVGEDDPTAGRTEYLSAFVPLGNGLEFVQGRDVPAAPEPSEPKASNGSGLPVAGNLSHISNHLPKPVGDEPSASEEK